MSIITKSFIINTRGFTDIIDITNNVNAIVQNENIKEGLLTVYVEGSTASITSIEYEPGLIKDLPELLDHLIPRDKDYHHDKTWQDGNGYAHLRASIIGNSMQVPVVSSHLQLGTWQQIVLIDFDNKPRSRKITVQIVV